MARIPSTTPLFVPSVPFLRLGEKLASSSPGHPKYSIFSANGTDANVGATKVARQYWKAMGKPSKFKVLHRIAHAIAHSKLLSRIASLPTKHREVTADSGSGTREVAYCVCQPKESVLEFSVTRPVEAEAGKTRHPKRASRPSDLSRPGAAHPLHPPTT